MDAGTENQANLHHEIYYHFLGTDQSEDILCWRDPENPKHTHSASVTDDGKVLSLITIYTIQYDCNFSQCSSLNQVNQLRQSYASD